MCEPAHSIVQWPEDFPDEDLPFGDTMDKESRLKAALGKAFGYLKKVGGFWHSSCLGSGHDKASGIIRQNARYLPLPADYEGIWWNRSFRVDGYFNLSDEAIKAAETYHNRVVFDSIQSFRRFLERSMEATTRMKLYWDTFHLELFNRNGRVELERAVRRAIPSSKALIYRRHLPHNDEEKKRFIKAVMGVTRKRHLFVSSFADDDRLWTPGQRVEG